MPAMLWQHDSDDPIGVWTDMAEDAKGLRVKGQLCLDTACGKEAYALLKMGALDGLSIGYRTLDVDPHPTKPGIINLKTLALREVSIVTFAANVRARIESVKHMLDAGALPTVRDFEGLLRDAGFSKAKAAAIAAGAKPHLRGEPEGKADNDAARFLKRMIGG